MGWLARPRTHRRRRAMLECSRVARFGLRKHCAHALERMPSARFFTEQIAACRCPSLNDRGDSIRIFLDAFEFVPMILRGGQQILQRSVDARPCGHHLRSAQVSSSALPVRSRHTRSRPLRRSTQFRPRYRDGAGWQKLVAGADAGAVRRAEIVSALSRTRRRCRAIACRRLAANNPPVRFRRLRARAAEHLPFEHRVIIAADSNYGRQHGRMARQQRRGVG